MLRTVHWLATDNQLYHGRVPSSTTNLTRFLEAPLNEESKASARKFLRKPGTPGGFGAIMDEYARAAEDLCQLVESIPSKLYVEVRESDDPDTTSIQEICRHVVGAAYGYSLYVRELQNLPKGIEERPGSEALASPQSLRPQLTEALRHTEETLEGLHDADLDRILELTFKSRWGQTYDPESIMEHGIVHILRHRRQIERWLTTS